LQNEVQNIKKLKNLKILDESQIVGNSLLF